MLEPAELLYIPSASRCVSGAVERGVLGLLEDTMRPLVVFKCEESLERDRVGFDIDGRHQRSHIGATAKDETHESVEKLRDKRLV